MKYISLLLQISGLLLPVLVLSAPIPPYRTMEVPYANIVVDGNADDGYSPVQNTEWIYPDQQEGYGGASDFTAVFRLAFNFDYLFLHATLTDDIAENYQWDYASNSMFDNIKWYIQLDTNTMTPGYDNGTEPFQINRGLDSVTWHGHVKRSEFLYKMKESTGTGWLTEVAMPWEAVYTGGILPEEIRNYMETGMGFEFMGCDADNSDGNAAVGNRDYQTIWDGDGCSGIANELTCAFGCIYFNIPDAVPESLENEYSIYPNPANDKIFIKSAKLINRTELVDVSGEILKVAEFSEGNFIDVSDLKEGYYLLRMFFDNNHEITKPFIINRLR